MAFQIPAPSQMLCKGNSEKNWETFKEAYDDYIIATEIDKKEKKVIVATLKTLMGEDCRKTLAGLKLPKEQMEDPEEIAKALTDNFVVKRNILYDRYKFYTATQQPKESVEQFVDRLRSLATSARFLSAEVEAEAIRDILVLGCQDEAARARIFRKEGAITLKSAIEMLRVSEATSQQLKTISGEQYKSVHFTKKNRPDKKMYKDKKKESRSKSTMKTCRFCAEEHQWGKSRCPAFGKKCTKCQVMNHSAKACRNSTDKKNRRSHKIEETDDDSDTESESDADTSDTFKLEQVAAMHNGEKKLLITLNLQHSRKQTAEMQCEIDSGSSCCVMSPNDLRKIQKTDKIQMKSSNTKLRMYNDHIVPVEGEVTLKTKRHGITYDLPFKIIKTSQAPIISRAKALEMELITIAEDVHQTITVNPQMTDKEFERQLLQEYSDRFDGDLGCLPGEYKIDIDKSVTTSKQSARRIPVPIKKQVKEKLDDLETRNVIKKVSEPTDWVSNLMIVRKPGKLRLCLDPRELNKALKRPRYPIPTIEGILPELAKAKVFSVLDAKDGFWQVKLAKESSELTTFATPFGRYKWLRLPFGISTAPEEFQRRQHEIIDGLTGVQVIADDFLIYGQGDTQEQATQDHDENLRRFLDRAREVNLKINKKKLKLRLTEVKYIGHILSAEGVKIDPEKVRAVTEMPAPTTKKAVQRLIGCVTYLAKFLPSLSTIAEPLRRLTDKDTHFEWMPHHDDALKEIKQRVTEAPVLQYYDIDKEVTIQCDASESGLGATLLQEGRPITFASRALTSTERNYAQIEKELLGIVFACERFNEYIYARDVTVHTDHKPLITLQKKPIGQVPKRLQRMFLRLQKYKLDIHYLPGPQMYIADWLSRAYLPETHSTDKIFDELEHINQIEYVNVSESTQHQLQNATKADPALMELMLMVQHGWPETRDEVPICIREYFTYRDEITAQNGILFKGQRVIIPVAMRPLMTSKAHNSHQGVDACIRRARDSLFWPGMTVTIKEHVMKCAICNSMQPKQTKESMKSWEIPTRPWQIVGQDLFQLNNRDYLITVDFYSDYWELDKLTTDTRSKTIVKQSKRQFARHGIPKKIVSDNGPQFVAHEYAKFTKDWDIQHVTSSPRHSQSNGKAESAVKIAKTLIQKAKMDKKDVHLTILDWRNTPNEDGKSPAQMLMSRRTRTLLPVTDELLQPKVVEGVPEDIKTRKQKAKHYYDKTAKDLPELDIGETVRIQPDQPKQPWRKVKCLQKVGPRSYLVEAENGQKYRRNRKFLRTTGEELTETPQSLETTPEKATFVEPPEKDTTTESSVKTTPVKKSPLKATASVKAKTTSADSRKTPHKSTEPRTITAPTDSTKSTRTRANIKQPARFNDFE